MDKPMEDADNTENNCGKRRATNVDETIVEEGSYWDSPEAKKLFLGTTTDERSVQEVATKTTNTKAPSSKYKF
jgi:hypothetical protein